MSFRKHRRVRKTWGGCRCPPGSKRVDTYKTLPDGSKQYRGRGWGCLGRGVSQKGKAAPRFVAALCDSPSDLEPVAKPRKPRGRPKRLVEMDVPASLGGPKKPRQGLPAGIPSDIPMPHLTAQEQARMLPRVIRPPFLDEPEVRVAKEIRVPKEKPKQLRLPFTRKVS